MFVILFVYNKYTNNSSNITKAICQYMYMSLLMIVYLYFE